MGKVIPFPVAPRGNRAQKAASDVAEARPPVRRPGLLVFAPGAAPHEVQSLLDAGAAVVFALPLNRRQTV